MKEIDNKDKVEEMDAEERRKRKYEQLRALYMAGQYQEVLDRAGGMLEDDPSDRFALYLHTLSLLSNGHGDEAEEGIRQLLALDPEDAEYLRMQGELHNMRMQYDDAAACFEQCISKQPEDAGYYLAMACALFDGLDNERAYRYIPRFSFEPEYLTRLNRAISLLHEANRLRPDHAYQWAVLGGCFTYLGQPEQAFECLQKAIVMDPNLISTHIFLASHYINAGDLQASQQHCGQALMLDPHQRHGLHIKKRIDFFRQQPKEFYKQLAAYWDSLCLLYPSEAAHWRKLIQLKLEYGKDLPLKELKAYLKLKPSDWEMQLTYGKALYDGKRYRAARQHFKKLERLEPGNPHVRSWQETLSRISPLTVLGRSIIQGLRWTAMLPLKLVYHVFRLAVILIRTWKLKKRR